MVDVAWCETGLVTGVAAALGHGHGKLRVKVAVVVADLGWAE